MAGLLDFVLPAIFSAGDSVKRQIKGLLGDPVGTVKQFINNKNDQAAAHLADVNLSTQGRMAGLLGVQPTPEQLAADQRWNQALANGYNPAGMIVWHGSPYKFSKFDSSKIGTGEGAQAYGHGLYLAEAPEVADTYRAMQSPMPRLYKDGAPFEAKTYAEMLAESRALGAGSLDEAIARQTRRIQAGAKDGGGMAALEATGRGLEEEGRILDALRNLKTQGYEAGHGGSLYKVDLPDEHIAKMLDWDKPLSQQAPDISEMLRARGMSQEMSGKDVWETLVNAQKVTPFQTRPSGTGFVQYNREAPARATTALLEAGIPGIRYLDGGSRAAGQGTANYVIFPGNEGLLTILERNGVPLR